MRELSRNGFHTSKLGIRIFASSISSGAKLMSRPFSNSVRPWTSIRFLQTAQRSVSTCMRSDDDAKQLWGSGQSGLVSWDCCSAHIPLKLLDACRRFKALEPIDVLFCQLEYLVRLKGGILLLHCVLIGLEDLCNIRVGDDLCVPEHYTPGGSIPVKLT